MSEKIVGIVLSVIRHNDRHNIVTLYTRERGRMSFLSASGVGKTGRLRNARLQPLSVIEADVNVNPTKELLTLPKFSAATVRRTLYFDPVKQSITLFLQEFLDKLMRSSAPDPALYEYIARSLDVIDSLDNKRCQNAHIAFLAGLLGPMGIEPNLEGYQPGDWFDMRGGEFVAGHPLHSDHLLPSDAAFLPHLGRMTIRNSPRFRLTGDDRQRILRLLLRYYSIHFPGIGRLNSLDILREVYR